MFGRKTKTAFTGFMLLAAVAACNMHKKDVDKSIEDHAQIETILEKVDDQQVIDKFNKHHSILGVGQIDSEVKWHELGRELSYVAQDSEAAKVFHNTFHIEIDIYWTAWKVINNFLNELNDFKNNSNNINSYVQFNDVIFSVASRTKSIIKAMEVLDTLPAATSIYPKYEIRTTIEVIDNVDAYLAKSYSGKNIHEAESRNVGEQAKTRLSLALK